MARVGSQIHGFFLAREQIEQQRHQPRFIEPPCDETIPLAVPAAAAAMDKEDDAARGRRPGEIAVERRAARGDFDFCFHVQSPSG